METIGLKGLKETQTIMKLTFGIIPIAAGLDKFTNFLTDWAAYINPLILHVLPLEAHTFMMIIGVIEIIAGIIVLFRPAIGAYIVSAWLLLIALSLFAEGKYLDVAVRDIAMSLSTYVLARLTLILKLNTVH
jgi:hypothetical protein